MADRLLPLCALVSLIAALGLVHATIEERRVRLVKVPNAAVVMAPATIRLQIHYHPQPGDRCARIVADGTIYRRSDTTIPWRWNAETASWEAPTLLPALPLELRDLPPGAYDLSAGIGTDTGPTCNHLRAAVTETVTVH